MCQPSQRGGRYKKEGRTRNAPVDLVKERCRLCVIANLRELEREGVGSVARAGECVLRTGDGLRAHDIRVSQELS